MHNHEPSTNPTPQPKPRPPITIGRRVYARRPGKTITVPSIRLSGKRLEAAGFREGAKVEVQIGLGKITLVALNWEIELVDGILFRALRGVRGDVR